MLRVEDAREETRSNKRALFGVDSREYNGRFYTKDVISVWTNLDRHLQFVCLCVSGIKTSTTRIICLDELSRSTSLKTNFEG